MASGSDGMPDEIVRIFRGCKRHFATAAIFSLAINLLYLAGPLYMMQVYDRVISSGSLVTLIMLTILLAVAYAALSGLDVVRARILARAAVRLDRSIGPRVVESAVQASLRSGRARVEVLRDFDNFRQTAAGAGIHALFDLPWAPIYIVTIFALHPLLGAFALACAIVLFAAALANEQWVRTPLSAATVASSRNYAFTDMSLRNAEAIRAMGMSDGLLRRWQRDRDPLVEHQTVASDRAAAMASVIRFLRLFMQSAILALGAYLAIEKATTVGAIFAASLLLGRAMAPVELIVGSWRSIASARDAYRRTTALLTCHPPASAGFRLGRPVGILSAENLGYSAPGSTRPILRAINFRIGPAEILGVVGPSGAGKSTLARHLVGVISPSSGSVRLDDADLSSWSLSTFGRYIGYLPQDVELFADTVAANIGRFSGHDDILIVDAARLAGVHEMILRLPQGYETPIGEGGHVLSGGYRQRIGLARAVYGDPSLVVLDEPGSSLDTEGESALLECMLELRRRGTTVVIISHRPSALRTADKILVVQNGVGQLFKPRADVAPRVNAGGPHEEGKSLPSSLAMQDDRREDADHGSS